MPRLVYVITANEKEAEKIAKTLVEEKLAACANIFSVRSIYKWAGDIQREDEVAMFIKTRVELVDKIISRVKELHSYEVPCIISLPIEKGYVEFLKWIDNSTK